MTPQQEAARILNWYLEQLAQRAGIRWTAENRADIQRAALLLAQSDQPADTIPPCPQPQRDPTTVVLNKQQPDLINGDQGLNRWREQRDQADAEQTRRLLRRNGSESR